LGGKTTNLVHNQRLNTIRTLKFGFEARDLFGFVDGTANPTGLDLPASALVGDEDGDSVVGSYVVIQIHLHDLGAWAKVPTPLQEEIIGRTKIDNIEIDDDNAPRNSRPRKSLRRLKLHSTRLTTGRSLTISRL
jgi:deferrochelatase/peroxidase EfeB